jgi:hypothetical protein
MKPALIMSFRWYRSFYLHERCKSSRPTTSLTLSFYVPPLELSITLWNTIVAFFSAMGSILRKFIDSNDIYTKQ